MATTIPFMFSIDVFTVAGEISVHDTPAETTAKGVFLVGGLPAGAFELGGSVYIAECVVPAPVPTRCSIQIDRNQRFVDAGIASWAGGWHFSGWKRMLNY